ncbi:substrate-binding periplasmic protein [Inhella gelatinilytica]|uniref:Transporter substrate-binding domain-containing protein n=1 Tax=Inhella gelatinilytica TaxID=2795030 RepID=A0A931IYN4_9BURK|nr:transporter substrate-binding domain-containing protein [Inhella gelatinilytica]MBH9553514.1 transporter substrate-binding domain-containing protein [Inhella gelatinilytica]
MRRLLIAGLLVGVGADAQAQEESWPNPLPVCDDGAEWPPFTHFKRDDAGRPTSAVVGFSVEVLERILTPLGRRITVELLPWARCQMEVAEGQRYAMALNASPSPERTARFLMTRPFYQTHHSYFYSKRQFPQGLRIRTLADLGRYRICGVHGYNYAAYQLPPGALDSGAQDVSRVVIKLHAGRCDLGLEKWEILVGTRITGQNLLADPDLAVGEVPELPPGDFHMLVSRRYPALARAINQGLERLEASGELAKIRARYVPQPGGGADQRGIKGLR